MASSIAITDDFDDLPLNATNITREFPENLYAISYMYYSLIGTFITMLVGTVVSYVTSDREADAYDQRLLYSVVYKLSHAWPGEERYYVNNPKIKAKSVKNLEGQCNGAFDEKPKGKV